MDRIEFAKLLNSITVVEGTPSGELDMLMKPIVEAIFQMMPNKLFRFRTFNKDTFDAFRSGMIYAVTADKFNDPYDTLPRYDIEEIKKGVSAIMSCKTLEWLKDWFEKGNDFSEQFKQYFSDEMIEAFRTKILSIENVKNYESRVEECKREIMSSIEIFFPVISETSKKFSTTACFCEEVQNILMWSHYAGSHKGFALEYNFRPMLEKPIKNVGLFPVIYREERLDVSSYIGWAYLQIMGLRTKNPDTFASIKAILHKSSVWSYEKEWRLIDFSPREITDDRASAIPYEPVAIYYGQHMSKENKLELHSIAQEKGIREYEMYVDYASPVYEMRWREKY